ncbi:MAG: substrate-binding domain-containing protein [Phycisphaerales bacterium]|nr:substrate-binding domain-containing protein [Phycisphaerales bacterium]
MVVTQHSFQRSRKRIYRIALFTSDMDNYGEQAVQEIVRSARQRGNCSIAMAIFDEVSEQDVAAGLTDGIIIDNWKNHANLLEICRNMRVPVVDISGDGDLSDIGIIAPDDRLVGTRAAEYFISRGFRHYAFYGLPYAIRTVWGENRKVGFSETLREAGYECAVFESAATAWDQLHQKVHLQALEHWLVNLPRPVGIFTCIDKFAYEILHLARKKHIRVPGEFAVCAVDNRVWICLLANPTISSIPLDGRKVGMEAIDMLMRMMKSGKLMTPARLVEPLPIIHRESTDTYAFPDADVVGALNFIRENAHKPISIEDILDHLVVSRRSLEMRFKELTGVTLQNQIWFAHVELSKKLLLETAQPMYKICENSGFSSAAVFNVVFRRFVGTTPTTFRRRTREPAP